ncbi:MAG: GAF domain-containing protein [Chloroflexota bacterium]|nr:GAF domain-containing protein [Chloroflexota bacterium]
MSELSTIPIAITLVLIGSVILVLSYFLTRVLHRISSRPIASIRTTIESDLPTHDDAALVIQSGGRVTYMNREAHTKFKVWDNNPTLERLARRTRPENVFLNLCAFEGRSRFSIEGQLMEGTSYAMPGKDGNAILLSLRRYQITAVGGDEETENPSQAIEIITTLGQSMASDLELEATLQAILSGVEQLVPTDFTEIAIWDTDKQHLIPYRYVGAKNAERHIEVTPERYSLGEGYPGFVAEKREPLRISNVDSNREIRPIVDRQKKTFHSYLGVPLLIGAKLIGTLDLTSLSRDAYTENDAQIIDLLSGQAAVAIHNALMYRQEKQRALELSSLANLSQAVSAVQDSKDLFAHLVNEIAPLLDVEITGFIIYDEMRQELIAQQPFIGVPPPFVDLYHVPITVDSPAEVVWKEQKTLITTNAPEDTRLIDLGLDHPARAAGIQNTVLTPLKVGGRSLGYLQVANKQDGNNFIQDDIRLLAIIAGQAAPIIENADLMQHSRQRAFRAEALRRIASLTGSEAELEEILKYSTLELSRLLEADVAVVYYLEKSIGELQAYSDSMYGISPEVESKIKRLPIGDEHYNKIVSNTQQPFLSNNILVDKQVLDSYQLLIDELNLQSLINVPLVFRGRGLGEIILGSRQLDNFTRSDLQLVATVAGQLAIAVERASLALQTDVTLRQRIEQLMTLTRVSREINTLLDAEQVLERVYEEVMKITRADCGMAMLFAQNETCPQSPEIAMQFGDHQRKNLLPLELIPLKDGTAILIENYDHPPKNIDASMLQPAHEGVRSAMLVPITCQNDIIGLFHLYALTPDHFDGSALQIVQTLAAQSAIAIANARRHQKQIRVNQQFGQRVEELTNIIAYSKSAHMDHPVMDTLRDIVLGIHAATSFPTVLIGLCNQQDELRWMTGAGISSESLQHLREIPINWPEVQNLLRSEYLLVSSYFIPIEEQPVISEWLSLLATSERQEKSSGAVLLIPLFQVANEPLGLIGIGSLSAAEYPDRHSLEVLEEFARQLALMIKNHNWVKQLETHVQTLELQLKESRESAVNILGKRLLAQSEQRVNAVLEIVETLARQPDRSAILKSLGQGLIDQLGLDIAVVVEMGSGGPQITHALGDLPENINLEALLGQRNPLHSSLRAGEIHLVADAEANEAWKQSPLLQSLSCKSFISLPVLTQAGAAAAILAASADTLPHFTLDNEQLFDLLARQTGTALNNLTLLTETGQRLRQVNMLLDFGRQLGGLEPGHILNLLLESALEVIQPAQASMTVIFDQEQGVIKPQAARGYANDAAMLDVEFRPGESLIGQVFEKGTATRIDEIDFAAHYNLEQDDLLRYREATGEELPLSSMVVPIQAGENRLGVLVLDNFQEASAFSLDEQALVASLTRQAALTLTNIRLYRAAEQQALQLEGLNDVSATITAKLEFDTLIHSLLETLEAIVPYDTGTLWLHDDGVLSICSVRGFANNDELIGITTTADDSPLFTEMLQSGQPISIDDIRNDPRFISKEHERLSWLAVPLTTKGEVIGVIALEKKEVESYNIEHIRILTTFANQAAVAIQNARLFAQTQQFAEELEQRVEKRTQQLEQERWRAQSLLKIMRELSASLDLDHVLNRTLKVINKIIGAEQSTILLIRSDERTFYHRASLGYTAAPPPGGQSTNLPIDEGLAGWVVNKRESVLIDDLRESIHWVEVEGKTTAHRSALGLPLMVGAEILGVFLFFHRQVSYFTPEQIEMAQAAVNQVAVSINKAELFNLIREQSESLGSMLHTQQVETSRSRAILEAVADGVLVTDANRQITLFNNSAQRILNLEQTEVIGKSLEDFSGLFGKAAQTWINTIKEWSSSSTHTNGDSYAEQITLDDQSVVSVHLAPVRMRAEFLGTVSIFRDITHQIEVDRLKSEFVATVSHELRTPMTSIKGYVDVLLMGAAGQLTEKQAGFLQVVQSNTERLNVLVNDLLDVSRIEAGKVDLSMQALRLRPLIEEIVQEQKRKMHEDGRKLLFDVNVSPDLPSVRGDDDRVRQILTNLVSNAYCYTPNGGHIFIGVQLLDDEVQIDIQDDGIGICPEEHEQIFERFYRGENPMVLATAGTGLGLSIVRRLVEIHEGRIWIESSGVSGDGSIFSFTLPIVQEG